MAPFRRGLYVVTPDEQETAVLVRQVGAALAGGAVAVQYRNKVAPAALRHEQAVALAAICRIARAPLIVNDDAGLALQVGAEGVHLGRDDGDIAEARARVGPQKLLGASCYNEFERARRAAAAGADYVAFGSVFPSPTKQGAVHAPLELVTAAKRALTVPIVAIGGITLENAPQVIRAGADAIAVITAVFDAPDVEVRARAFQRLFEEVPP